VSHRRCAATGAREQPTSDDRIAVLSFGGTQDHGGAFRRRRAFGCRPLFGWMPCFRLHGQTTGAKSGGLTPLFDALIFAAISSRNIAAPESAVLILFSDGTTPSACIPPAKPCGRAGCWNHDLRRRSWKFPDLGGKFLQRVADGTGVAISIPLLRNQGAAALLNTVFEDLRASYVSLTICPAIRLDFMLFAFCPRTISTLHSTARRVQLRTQRSLISDDGETVIGKPRLEIYEVHIASCACLDRYLRCVRNADRHLSAGNRGAYAHGRLPAHAPGFMNQFGPPQAAMIEDSCPEYTLVTDKVVLSSWASRPANLCRWRKPSIFVSRTKTWRFAWTTPARNQNSRSRR